MQKKQYFCSENYSFYEKISIYRDADARHAWFNIL